MGTPVAVVAGLQAGLAVALAIVVTLMRFAWPRRRRGFARGQFAVAISDRQGALSAWSATYTQASLVELEGAKVIMVVMGAMLVVSTTVASVWPGATLPAATTVVLVVGQLVGVLPLIALTESHQDRLARLVATMAFKLGPETDLCSIALPTVKGGKIAHACTNLALAVIAISAGVLAAQIAFATALPECTSGVGLIFPHEITICARDLEKLKLRANP